MFNNNQILTETQIYKAQENQKIDEQHTKIPTWYKIVKGCTIICILGFIAGHTIITGYYCNSRVMYYGMLQYAYVNSAKIAVCLAFLVISLIVTKRATKPTSSAKSRNTTLIADLVANLVFIALLTADLVIFMKQFDNIDYGPLTIINGNQTQIHWYTKAKTSSMVQVGGDVYSDPAASHYHNVLVNGTNFNYAIEGFDQSFSYALPQETKKFIVMTDIHGHDEYLTAMDQDYDFGLFAGDYSYGGMAFEFSKTFKRAHQKPLILAVGNHDSVGQIDSLVTRPRNFYQSVNGVGFYVIYILNDESLWSAQRVNHDCVDEALDFINQNAYLSENNSHVFIVSHRAVYSAGENGSDAYFTTKFEEFMATTQLKNIRCVFSGHDHVFSAFKKDNVMYLVAGSGGGPLDGMMDMGARSWDTEEISGPLPEKDSSMMGYQHHLESFVTYTRTEVNIESGKIVYHVRDLTTMEVKTTFEQVIQ
ncbi:Alkaline_phosphatase [Hexamita inflata]|uniref:Alkaline phosphatase n=1 Tax=Hexamita inflata TaxID=28002 RepID=A0AA86TJF1_9EUKA|nr:Alkaline phosphatase [Hexamita inflata]